MCVCVCEMILNSDSILFLHHILCLDFDLDGKLGLGELAKQGKPGHGVAMSAERNDET